MMNSMYLLAICNGVKARGDSSYHICSRAIIHKMEKCITEGSRLAFTRLAPIRKAQGCCV